MTESHNREHVRIETNALVDYAGTEVLLFHRIQNISLGGLSIRTPTLEPKGTQVTVAVNFPDLGESIEVEGEVAWVHTTDPKEMGIKFLRLTEAEQDILERYMEQRSQVEGN